LAPKDQTPVVYTAAPLSAYNQSPDNIGHRYLEGITDIFIILTIIAVLMGSVIEILPTLLSHQFITPLPGQKPYTALELAGRDLYIREGCYTCHSQMVRPLQAEVLRYGERSHIEESMYDHPFQWGSKRTGPDLARVGGKYPNLWHYRNMMDPRAVTPKSIMPTYPWLYTQNLDYDILRRKLAVMKQLGVPYSEQDIAEASALATVQANVISAELEQQGAHIESKKEIIALIAYLQTLKYPKPESKIAHEK
jgi:cytochrome c oxidase cbb3-type subunit I/II